jgi:hypothetical protein
VSDQHLIKPEEEEVAEHNATFFNNITVMCNKVEDELYRLRVQDTRKRKTYY